MKTEDDIMDEVMGFIGDSKEKLNRFKKEYAKVLRGTGDQLDLEILMGILVKMGLGDKFDSMEFLTKYLVSNDSATIEKHTSDYIIKEMMKQNNVLLCNLVESQDKILTFEQYQKYDKSEIETLKINNEKLKRTSDGFRDELKAQQKENNELRIHSDRELETNIELMDENERLEYDNQALKHIIKICGN